MATSKLNIQITAVDHASQALKSIQSGIIRLVGAIVALGAAFKAITFPAKAAADFEREMVNVAKTTGFTDSQIEKLSGTMIGLSKTMSVSATELAAVAAIAGQLGLGSFGVEAIEKFTESVAKASVTLGLSVEKAAEFGAQISSIFNLDPSNIENVFSTLNELSNTSVATAGQLADIIKRVGSVGGITLQQSAGLAAFFRDLGVQVEVAGTSTVKVLSNMSAKAKDFAKVAGLSMQQWTELMKKDTVAALTLVTSKLYEMDRAQRDATAKELFGGGRILASFTKVIDDAANGYERLYTHIDNANTSYALGTSSLEEYDKVMESTSEQTKVMLNSMRALAIEMGEHLIPIILDMVKTFQKFLASDEGRDFFFQVAEGIKVFIQSIQNAIGYLAALNINWYNTIRALTLMAGAMLTISGIKMFAPMLAGAGRLLGVLNTLSVVIVSTVAGLYKLGKSLFVVSTVTRSVGIAALFASRALPLLALVIVPTVAAFAPLIAVLTAATALLVYFKDEITEFFGFKSEAEIAFDLKVRIDKRRVAETTKKALNTIHDLVDRVTKASKLTVEVPLEIAPVADQVAYVERIVREFGDAQTLKREAEVLKENMEKYINDSLSTLDIDALQRIQLSIGDLYGVEDFNKQIVIIQTRIEELRKNNEGSWFDVSQTSSEFIQLQKELARLREVASKARSELKEDWFEGLQSAQAVDQIKEFIDNIKSRKDELQKNIGDLEISIKLKEEQGGAGLDDQLREQYAKLASAQQELRTLDFDSTKTVADLRKFKKAAEAVKFAVQALGPALSEVQRKADAIEFSLGTEALEETLRLTIAIDQNMLLLAKAELDYEKAVKGSEDAVAKQLKGQELRKQLTEDRVELEKIYTTQLDASAKKAIELVKKKSQADKIALQTATKTNKLTEENTQSTEQRNTTQLKNLTEQVKARKILKDQIVDFDNATSDAIKTAEKMDGAWDNIGKTIRAAESSAIAFGAKLDEILRKKSVGTATDIFELGIDKDTEDSIDRISGRYEDLVQYINSLDISDSRRSRYLEDLDAQRQALIETTNEEARALKLANQRKVAEQEVSRVLADQKKAQQDYSALVQDISDRQESGDFEGADGVLEYNKAMLDLAAGHQKVLDTSKSSRSALEDLAKVDTIDASALDPYRKKLEALDDSGRSVQASHIELEKTLADATVTLAATERLKLSTPYDKLNDSINTLIGTNKQLQTYEESLTNALDSQTLSVYKNIESLEARNTIALALAKNTKAANIALGESADLAKLEKDAVGLAKKDNTVEVTVVAKPVIDKASVKKFAEDVKKAVPEVKIKSVIEKPTQQDIKDNPVTVVEELILVTPVEADLDKTTASESLDGMTVNNVTLDVAELTGNLSVSGGDNAVRVATGGSISGAGSGTSDSILSWLSNGEYVIKASSVAKFGTSFFDMLNSGSMPLPRFATGGGFNLPSSSTMVAGSNDSVDLNFNFNDQTYTMHGERKQAKAIVDLFKNMTRG